MKGPQWHLAMVVSTISILPLLLTFLLAQRQFIAGLTSRRRKGHVTAAEGEEWSNPRGPLQARTSRRL